MTNNRPPVLFKLITFFLLALVLILLFPLILLVLLLLVIRGGVSVRKFSAKNPFHGSAQSNPGTGYSSGSEEHNDTIDVDVIDAKTIETESGRNASATEQTRPE